MANGHMAAQRIIEGQGTFLSRTMHGVAHVEVNDEISIPVALGGAILVFRGGASGEEPPIRVIQGSKTRMIRPQTIATETVYVAPLPVTFATSVPGAVLPVKLMSDPVKPVTGTLNDTPNTTGDVLVGSTCVAA